MMMMMMYTSHSNFSKCDNYGAQHLYWTHMPIPAIKKCLCCETWVHLQWINHKIWWSHDRKCKIPKTQKRTRKEKALRKKLPNPVSSHVPGWMRTPISRTRTSWRICSTRIRYRASEWMVSDVEKQHSAHVFDGKHVRTSANILYLVVKWITIIRNVGSCSASDVTPAISQ